MSRGAMYVVQCLAERPGDKAPRVCVARAWSLQTAGAQASREMATHASRFQQGARPERNTEADPTQLPRYGARGQTTELPKGEALRARLQRLIPEEGTTLVLMEHRHTLEVSRHCSARKGCPWRTRQGYRRGCIRQCPGWGRAGWGTHGAQSVQVDARTAGLTGHCRCARPCGGPLRDRQRA